LIDEPQSGVSIAAQPASGATSLTQGRQTFWQGRTAIRLKTAVTLLVLGGTLITALPLQWVWWRTARESSFELVDALSHEITSTVQREWWERVSAAEAAHGVAAALLDSDPTEATISRALGAALAATQVPSALTFEGKTIGPVLATRGENGQTIVHMMRGTNRDAVSAQPPQAGWREVAADPAGGLSAIAYTGSSQVNGSLSVFIGMDRFSDLLGAIAVGRTGAAFVVDPMGTVKIAPGQVSAQALRPVAEVAAAIVMLRPANAVNIVETRRLVVQDAGYRVSFSPLEFKGWQFVVIVPESEFLSGIEMTTRRALVGLLGLSLLLGLAAAAVAQRVLSEPVAALTSDLGKIERFELESISHRSSGLIEFDQLSAAMTRMSSGLADFAKFIPTDLVRTLLADGVRAAPGGETRQLTVMFADVVGFTKISERMGTAVIGVISSYLDVVSTTVEANGGTVDKYIGDAVMALWGAPRLDADQARNACRAALDANKAVRDSGITDDRGEPLQVRIGLHSGVAVVGNIGSSRRLNYTAIGDTVNLASRLEGVNKVFGTSILISEETRVEAGATFMTRELAEVSVVGRAEPIRIHELLGEGSMTQKPHWVLVYEQALQAFRQRKFAAAIRLAKQVQRERPDDGPSAWLIGICRTLQDAPPSAVWRGVVQLDSK
jgi:adenylate cyclase